MRFDDGHYDILPELLMLTYNQMIPSTADQQHDVLDDQEQSTSCS